MIYDILLHSQVRKEKLVERVQLMNSSLKDTHMSLKLDLTLTISSIISHVCKENDYKGW